MAPDEPAWCEHCQAAAATRDGLCAECWYDAVLIYPSGGMCAHCRTNPVEKPADIWCHECNVALEVEVDELTDDRPCND